MIFADRTEAGRILAKQLQQYKDGRNLLVLGLPRGGVSVAFEVATELKAPLDVFIVRKLGVPGHEELAFGAIASGGVRVLDEESAEAAGVSDLEIELIVEKERQELERRELAYRGRRAPAAVAGKTVILVDDGIATGHSMEAAIDALLLRKPARLVVAVPVAPFSTCRRLAGKVDDLIAVQKPESFYAVGEFYEDFSQISDQAVAELLRKAERNVA